jgi:hypothetical protein
MPIDSSAITHLEAEIAELEQLLSAKKRRLEELSAERLSREASQPKGDGGTIKSSSINNLSPPEIKIALFRAFFKGREDVYARRFESKKTGKSGYQPVCRNEWVKGVCGKPKTSCGSCANRAFEPVTDEVIRSHLAGLSPAKNEWGRYEPFVMGVYPLLQNETCCFLALDFDKQSWQTDAEAFMETCVAEDVPAVVDENVPVLLRMYRRRKKGTRRWDSAVWMLNRRYRLFL